MVLLFPAVGCYLSFSLSIEYKMQETKSFKCEEEQIEIKLLRDYSRIQELHIIQKQIIMILEGHRFDPDYEIDLAQEKIQVMKKTDKSTITMFYEDEGANIDIELRRDKNGYSLVSLKEKPVTAIYIQDINNLEVLFKNVRKYFDDLRRKDAWRENNIYNDNADD